MLLRIWWNQKSFIYYELLKSDDYQFWALPMIELSDALEKKRIFNGAGRRKVILLHDNENNLGIISDMGNSPSPGVFSISRSFGLSSFPTPATSLGWFPLQVFRRGRQKHQRVYHLKTIILFPKRISPVTRKIAEVCRKQRRLFQRLFVFL